MPTWPRRATTLRTLLMLASTALGAAAAGDNEMPDPGARRGAGVITLVAGRVLLAGMLSPRDVV